MLTSGPTTRRSHPIPWDDLQGAEIDAPDGEELMSVTAIASMPHELATWWRMPGAVGTLIGGTLL